MQLRKENADTTPRNVGKLPGTHAIFTCFRPSFFGSASGALHNEKSVSVKVMAIMRQRAPCHDCFALLCLFNQSLLRVQLFELLEGETAGPWPDPGPAQKCPALSTVQESVSNHAYSYRASLAAGPTICCTQPMHNEL